MLGSLFFSNITSATQFLPFFIPISTTINANELQPSRLVITGLNGGALITTGSLSASASDGAFSSLSAIVLESWDSDSEAIIEASWALTSVTGSITGITDDTPILSADIDVFFNDSAAELDIPLNATRIAVTVSSNKSIDLPPGETIYINLNISTEVVF